MKIENNLRKMAKLAPGIAAFVLAGFISLSVAPSFAATLSYPLAFSTGWNLAGNSLAAPLDAKKVFGAQTSIQTVWKWDATGSKWAFYAPSLDALGTLAAYATSKGYGVLATIDPGEGFWVNALAPVSLGTQAGAAFNLVSTNLVTGWNLAATGNDVPPSDFNLSLGATLPSPGTVPINLTTLWAWDNVNSAWYFYAPSMVANNTLASYIQDKGYKDFDALTLGKGLGFWINFAAAPDQPVSLAVQRVFPNLSFTGPVALQQAPGNNTRWFVVEQAGRVLTFGDSSNVATTDTFADIRDRVTSGGEMGLLGMAFHPGFPTNPRVYLSYTNQSAGVIVSRISEFRTTDAGATLDASSERILLTVNQPESNHNGGNIVFGPDGFLYIGFGDGGGGNDQHGSIGNAQLLTTLLGKMLRIDVDGASGAVRYGIPPDNPFAGSVLCGTNGTGTQSCPEIYAYGLRNPWRWSFDRQTGELWVADVGQSAREEVDRVTRNGNYGWRCFEGTRDTGLNCGTPATSPLPPVAEYGHDLGSSITGGYVYRGVAIPALAGRYVFGDFGSGRIWNLAANTAPTLTMTGGLQSGLNISSFAEANDGELYVVDYAGSLYRIVAQ